MSEIGHFMYLGTVISKTIAFYKKNNKKKCVRSVHTPGFVMYHGFVILIQLSEIWILQHISEILSRFIEG